MRTFIWTFAIIAYPLAIAMLIGAISFPSSGAVAVMLIIAIPFLFKLNNIHSHRQCPHCGTTIKKNIGVCFACGRDIISPSVSR